MTLFIFNNIPCSEGHPKKVFCRAEAYDFKEVQFIIIIIL